MVELYFYVETLYSSSLQFIDNIPFPLTCLLHFADCYSNVLLCCLNKFFELIVDCCMPCAFRYFSFEKLSGQLKVKRVADQEKSEG